MSTMRQRLLSMTRRVQERPCWLPDDVLSAQEIPEPPVRCPSESVSHYFPIV